MLGLIFDNASILAVASGRITQTRRPVDWPTIDLHPYERRPGRWGAWLEPPTRKVPGTRAPHYYTSKTIGCHAFTREVWAELDGRVVFQADHPDLDIPRWQSPIFQKEKDARLILRIDGVRLERLHSISRKDVVAEGLTIPRGADPLNIFRDEWTRRNRNTRDAVPWAKNPWVCVYTFAVHEHRARAA